MPVTFNINPEAHLVLAVARRILCNNESVAAAFNNRTDIDWKRFNDMLFYHRLTPFVYPGIKDCLRFFPEDMVKRFKTSYYCSLRSIFDYEHEFLRLCQLFEEKGVPLLPLKGVALIEDLYYECPVRVCSDIDVLVRKEDLKIACGILAEAGYEINLEGLKESYWSSKQYHFVFEKKCGGGRAIMVELHWDIDYPRRNIEPLDVFKRTREFHIRNKKIKLLSPEDTLFVLALHQRRFGEALSLKDVCDTALLLKKYSSTFDWGYVLRESKKKRLRSSVFFVLCQAHIVLGADIPTFVWKGLNVVFWRRYVVRRFIINNTFSARLDNCRWLYLRSFFLLYDRFWEPLTYILNISQEQFAKFFKLRTYSKKTEFFYHLRFLYIPIACVGSGLAGIRNYFNKVDIDS